MQKMQKLVKNAIMPSKTQSRFSKVSDYIQQGLQFRFIKDDG